MAEPNRIQLLNVRGLANHCEPRRVRRGKLDFLKDVCVEENSLFIGLTETWLHQDHLNAEVCPPGYDLIRQDREGRECGGVALLVRDNLTAEPLASFSNDGCEVFIVKIFELNHVCCVVYRPPGTSYSKFKQVFKTIDNTLNKLSAPTPDITVMGDFNFNSKDVTWNLDENGDLEPNIKPWIERQDEEDIQERRQAAELINIMDSHNMIQLVGIPTREREILDLIFCNNPDLFHALDSKPCPRVSDHNLVTALVTYELNQEDNSPESKSKEEMTILERFQQLKFHEADWAGIQSELRERQRLQNDWIILSELEPEEGIVWFYNQLIEIWKKQYAEEKNEQQIKEKHSFS